MMHAPFRPGGVHGYRHLIASFPARYDERSMIRVATEIRPMVEREAGQTVPIRS